MKFRNRVLLLFLITILFFHPLYSESIKIATWNILNFPGSTGTAREDDFRKIVEQLDLDVLVVQEILNADGVDQFLNNVMNYSTPGIYSAAPFFNGPDTDNALFYKDSKIELVSQDQILTALRDISEYVLKLQYGPSKNTEFRVYSFHLKAGTGTDNKAKREQEAIILRNHLNGLQPNSLFLLCGDYNMQSSDEAAFEVLVENQADNDGRAKDPIDQLGKWNDSETFSPIHSQSTRTTQFGGGARGGLDDRFDLILISYGFESSEKLGFIADSYFAYGNDGNHLNKAINEGTNSAVSSDIADALHDASDHMPVILELEILEEENFTISGNVRIESTGNVQTNRVSFVNVILNGLPGNPQTDASGNYSATVEYGWSGTATPSKAGYTFSPASRTYSNVLSNQADQDYSGTQFTYSISGKVRTPEGNDFEGVTLTFSGGSGSTTSDSNGNFSMTINYGWSGSVTPSTQGYAFVPSSRSYSNVISNKTNQDFETTLDSYTISGNISINPAPRRMRIAGIGLEGVVMSGLPGDPSTDSSGNYSAVVNGGWSGTVTPTKAGYSFSPSSKSYSNVTSDEIDQAYSANQITHTIQGAVWDDKGAAVEGVTFSFSNGGGTATTDANGIYSRVVNYGWTGTATPSKEHISFLPSSRNYINVTSSFLNQDYTCSRIIYAPLNFSGKQELNRSLSQAEYINVITWQANSNNENIEKYRIYQVEGNNKTLIVELNANTFRYLHRGVDKDASYTYSLVAVNGEGSEGLITDITI